MMEHSFRCCPSLSYAISEADVCVCEQKDFYLFYIIILITFIKKCFDFCKIVGFFFTE